MASTALRLWELHPVSLHVLIKQRLHFYFALIPPQLTSLNMFQTTTEWRTKHLTVSPYLFDYS